MAKKITKKIKLVITAGKATPAPPVGTALGPAGINIGEFVSKFNEATKDMDGVVPAEITVYEDRTFSFILKTPPASSLIMKALGIEKGAGKTPSEKVGTITKKQLEEIAQKKMVDLNANDMEAAVKIIAGTCRSMGVEVKG
ncbi:MAG: 50S ribosomal protein L11 [Candidatus Zambryskibacteria bacterium RIFCSPHIGHO2_12_FULL_38_34]|uniref:Large ribosomal subunit protein uL11 n=1 Tax=Candidatus Zambryskibacteria bacterium RIFCSPLOWO2_12_FULL_39_16 TaxID=1802775 RepID=A0A1G2UTE3_9BACT|nr:MAG: 50S ribosomal protein L11 [Candidatus Zambryskibacteria bacterium RIFCSPHIGHO2_02_FULL_38_22]OHA97672.1 MAG: 50S ribosomal protein L11 [Candidatus Zambryskibacteria bacterium RIFCSPHIGHO2_12_FULL_38_34]OHB08707.1 MAG: 50S ribosomal protein L11 [Candidatus Zambryskibacteria bacterium RIFCSPLOWO2_02_FULL_38_13]OHB12645.1 MAG: 50S ribosomal protein L11 [Candidatus Zambryskibacteria bacterium RIFCSPLOWO2_12_FULL_39_16]